MLTIRAKKLEIAYISYHMILFKFNQHVVQIMYGETLDFNVSVSNANIKCPVGNSIFAVNFTLKPFRTTVANADNGNLTSIHTLFDTHLDHILAKFEPNCVIRNAPTLSFLTKTMLFRTILDKALTLFARRCCG